MDQDIDPQIFKPGPERERNIPISNRKLSNFIHEHYLEGRRFTEKRLPYILKKQKRLKERRIKELKKQGIKRDPLATVQQHADSAKVEKHETTQLAIPDLTVNPDEEYFVSRFYLRSKAKQSFEIGVDDVLNGIPRRNPPHIENKNIINLTKRTITLNGITHKFAGTNYGDMFFNFLQSNADLVSTLSKKYPGNPMENYLESSGETEPPDPLMFAKAKGYIEEKLGLKGKGLFEQVYKPHKGEATFRLRMEMLHFKFVR